MSTNMPRFTNNAGQVWPLEITVQVIRECRRHLNVNLYDFAEADGSTSKALADPLLVCELAYAMANCERRGVSSEDFAAGMNGVAIAAAAAAVSEAIIAFFPHARRTVAQCLASDPALTGLLVEIALRLLPQQRLSNGCTNAPESSESTPVLTA